MTNKIAIETNKIAIDNIDRSEKKIPLATLIEYCKQGLSYREIAKIVGCNKTNVHARLRTVGYSTERAKHYRKNRVAIIEHIESKIIESIDDDDLQKASLLQKTTAFSQLVDKRRLEEGKPTSITQVADITQEIEHIEAEYRILSEKLNLPVSLSPVIPD